MKYLKKFENHTEYEEARQNLILPNVSLVSEGSKVYYNPKRAKLYDYLYSDLTYGTETSGKNIIGVCVIGGGILPDGKARFMSVKPMSLSSPDSGGESEEYIYWGGYNSNISALTDYTSVVTGETSASGSDNFGYLPKNGTYDSRPHIPSPINYFAAYSSNGATSDLDGKTNTEKILAVDNTASTDWQTATTITNDASTATVHPAAQCCWRFNPGDSNQGDWYLPAMGELGFVIYNFNEINSKISAASRGVQLDDGYSYWSSTEYSDYDAWGLDTSSGGVYNDYSKDDAYCVRAFLAL